MDDKTLASAKLAVPHIHWTAKVSCGFSVCMALVFVTDWTYQFSYSPWLAPLHQFLGLILYIFYYLTYFMPLRTFLSPLTFLYFIAFLFGCIALVISFRGQWKMGRRMAIVGVTLPGIILLLYGTLIVYLIFFWHPHIVF
jgi:hypothetical protein